VPVQLEQITVEGGSGGTSSSPNTNQATTDLGRLPGRVRDTPQVVNVVTQETMQQQNAQTLDQILRNVPGVTMASGEGNGGLAGDQFKIRGFEAKNDVYTDGLRDFGVYVRDSFAYEGVQVFKGPSSESFGMGTVGGAINTQLKKAHLGDELYVEGQVGTSPLGRAMVDWNKQLSETSALRFVLMGHLEDVAGRDNVESNRAGFLGTASFGIGTDLTWDFSYLYQHGDRTPDYGVPMVARGAATKDNPTLPITEFGVDRSSYYGKKGDHDIFDTHALTSRVKWEANETWTVYNDSRISYYDRDFATTNPACAYTTGDPPAPSCASFFFAGEPAFLSGFGGGNSNYEQQSWGIQNITTGVAKFETGTFRHELVAGLDLFHQDNRRFTFSTPEKNAETAAMVNVRRPGLTFDLPFTSVQNGDRTSTGTNIAVFASDRVWLTDQFSVLAGGRLDYYDAEYETNTTEAIGQETTEFSPKVSLIWEPSPVQTYYASWARSFTPPGQFVANSAIASINGAQPDLDPEISDLYEVGGKWNFLDGRLGVTAALFQIDKSNAFYTDPVTGDSVETGERQRVQGVELGLSGLVTADWTVGVAYSYLDSEVRSATGAGAANIGNEVGYVPQNAFSLWTSYDASRLFDLEGKLNVGGGVFYQDSYFTGSNNANKIPSSFSLDAFAAYEFKDYKVALNAYNLTNETNYTAGFSNRAVVGPGRSFTLTVGRKF
jgi:catecholate siderophore receptor